MWPWNACVIQKIPIHKPDLLRNDPDVAAYLASAGERLGRKGRFVLRLSGIPRENSVLAEGKNKRVCRQCITDFQRLLIQKGYGGCSLAEASVDGKQKP